MPWRTPGYLSLPFIMKSRVLIALALASQPLVGEQLPAQFTFDVTRSWTLCANRWGTPSIACGNLALRTGHASGGGSVVSVGITNLQGSDPRDNTFASLLNRAVFRSRTVSVANSWTAPDITTSGPATIGGGRWTFTGAGNLLMLEAAAEQQTVFNNVRQVYDLVYEGTDPTDDGWYRQVAQYQAPRNVAFLEETFFRYYGIGGFETMTGWTSTFSDNPIEALRNEVEVRQVCVAEDENGCQQYEEQYRPTEPRLVVVDQQRYDLTSEFFGLERTLARDAMVWFTTQSAGAFDARDVDFIGLQGFANSSPNTEPIGFFCSTSNTLECSVSETTEQVTPEPASLILFGSGLVGFGAFGWRRRRTSR